MSNVGPAASDSELSLDFDNIDSHTDYLLTENLPVKVKENGFTGSLLTQTSTPLPCAKAVSIFVFFKKSLTHQKKKKNQCLTTIAHQSYQIEGKTLLA